MALSLKYLSELVKTVKSKSDEESVLDSLDIIMGNFFPLFYSFLLSISEKSPESPIEVQSYAILEDLVQKNRYTSRLKTELLAGFYQILTQQFSVPEIPEDVLWHGLSMINDEDASFREKNINATMVLKQFTPQIHKRINYYKKTRKDLRDLGDLESVAMIALTKSIQKFDPDQGTKFRTYLVNGLHHELIGAYRKMVKQGMVEAVNATEYFYKNEGAVEIEDEEVYDDPEDIEKRERSIRFMEYITDNVELTIGESLYFFMYRGIFNDKYSHKDIKKILGLNKSQLQSATQKVYAFLFEEEIKLLDI